MPSSAKTEKLGLNNWAGADTPKRADVELQKERK